MNQNSMSTNRRDLFVLLIFLVAAASVALQYWIVIRAAQNVADAGAITVRFVSYFTILFNTLVALTSGFAIFVPESRLGRFFTRPSVRGAIATYAAVGGGIYFLLLRHLWNPQGAQWWADMGLHYAVPLLYLTWWLLGNRHGSLQWRNIAPWLLFPLVYFIWTLLRGVLAQKYPYPFVDVNQFGYAKVFLNAVGMTVLFASLGAVFVALDKVLGRSRASARRHAPHPAP